MTRAAHKYHAQPTTLDGIRFASKAEARRYAELKLLEKAGEIRGLVLQPKYLLHAINPDDAMNVIGAYVADFAYLDANNAQVVEDVKGFKTPLYRWKAKHMAAQYGITITEIGRATPAPQAKRAQTPRRSNAK